MAIIPVDVQKVQKVAPPRSLFTFRVQGSPGGLFGHSSMTFVVPKWSKYLWILNEKAWFFRSQISMNHYKSSTGWPPPVMCCCWFINHEKKPMKTSSWKIYHRPWYSAPFVTFLWQWVVVWTEFPAGHHILHLDMWLREAQRPLPSAGHLWWLGSGGPFLSGWARESVTIVAQSAICIYIYVYVYI